MQLMQAHEASGAFAQSPKPPSVFPGRGAVKCSPRAPPVPLGGSARTPRFLRGAATVVAATATASVEPPGQWGRPQRVLLEGKSPAETCSYCPGQLHAGFTVGLKPQMSPKSGLIQSDKGVKTCWEGLAAGRPRFLPASHATQARKATSSVLMQGRQCCPPSYTAPWAPEAGCYLTPCHANPHMRWLSTALLPDPHDEAT